MQKLLKKVRTKLLMLSGRERESERERERKREREREREMLKPLDF